jgi:serine/threonine protein kinase
LHLNDFGIARSSNSDHNRINTTTGRAIGSPLYLAPEILNAIKVKPDFTKQDVWAIGVITYQMCTFNLPFTGFENFALINAILNHPPDPITHEGYSAELKALIDQLLTKDPTKRPSIKQLFKIQIIRKAIIRLVKESEPKLF